MLLKEWGVDLLAAAGPISITELADGSAGFAFSAAVVLASFAHRCISSCYR